MSSGDAVQKKVSNGIEFGYTIFVYTKCTQGLFETHFEVYLLLEQFVLK